MTKIRPSLSKKNKFYISRHAFYTAYHFALQYSEWKDKYDEIMAAVTKGVDYEKDASRINVTGDPTQRAAIKLDGLAKKLDMINEIAIIAGEDLSKFILQAVTTEGVTYNYLRQRGMPCSRNEFYMRRRKFYYLLSSRLEEK